VAKTTQSSSNKTSWLEIEGTIASLEKSVRILCWLSEEVEKNVAVVKKAAPYGFCETFEDLAAEQAYRVKALVETLKREWERYDTD